MKRKTIVSALVLAAALDSHAATTIALATNVVVSGVRPFGINMAQVNYYDSGQVMKELLFRNPGFEGMLFQSVVRVGSGNASQAVEDQPFTQWPSGFWDGAAYEFAWGVASGRAGVVTHSMAPNRAGTPNDPAGDTNGTTYVFGDSGVVPAAGDYLILRKSHIGGTNGGAAFGSWAVGTGGAGSVTSETNDLPPDTEGRQCVRLTALGAGDQASVSGQFDTLTTRFVLLNGSLRLAFKARGVGGANRVFVTVQRGSLTPYLSQTVQLSAGWADYELPFSASETATVSGTMTVRLAATGQSEVLLDDVSLRQTGGDTTNPTAFRDPVVQALRELRPGILRNPNWQSMGESLDNELAPLFGRMRSGYSVYNTSENNMRPGLHEFLELCENLGAEPWYCMPPVFSIAEATNLVEYLAGGTNTAYGARRAARGHPAPWTGVFPRIHLEFGNENWNNGSYRGGAITVPVPCGNRASGLFAAMKAAAGPATNRFSLVLGGNPGMSGMNVQLHNASPHHDAFALAPYMAYRIDTYADPEALFGTLFAEPEWWSTRPSPTSGLMRLTHDLLQASPRPVPLSVYEVNLHTTEGAISQEALDTFTPSVGASIAVAGHMFSMLRHVGIRDQVFFSLPGHRYTRGDGKTAALWGAAPDYGVSGRRRPQFFSQVLANEALALRGDLVATTHSGDDPTWDQPYMNRVSYTNAHHLQSFAFANGPDRALVVFNYHRTSPLDVTFAGAAPPLGAVAVRQLTSGNVTDHNETNAVVAVVTQEFGTFDPGAPMALPPFSMTVFHWSTVGPPVSIAPTNAGGAVRIEWDGAAGREYQVQTSRDFVTWSDAGPRVPGAGGPTVFLDDGTHTGTPPSQTDRRFYRVFLP